MTRDAKRGRARVSHIRRFNALAAAASVEAAPTAASRVGFNLNFSLDSARGGFKLTSQRLAATGTVEARVYRDLNDNGVRDPAEPWEEGALITTGPARVRRGHRQARRGPRRRAAALPAGRGRHRHLQPAPIRRWRRERRCRWSSRAPASPRELEIGLVGAGDIEGVLVQDDGRGFEGLDVELVDAAGKVVATARSDFDGFFLFERVAYGRYTLPPDRAIPPRPRGVERGDRQDASKSARTRPSSGWARSGSSKADRIALAEPAWQGFATRALTKSRLATTLPIRR